MRTPRKSFDLDDMARAIKDRFDQQIPTVAAARELSEAFYLLIVKALIEGKRVYAPNQFNMVLIPPRKSYQTTPHGEPWEGFLRPKLKATIHAGFYGFLQEAKDTMNWPEGSLDAPFVRVRQRAKAKAKKEKNDQAEKVAAPVKRRK